MFSKFFRSKPAKKTIEGYAKLNMRLRPEARGQLFEEPLITALEESKLGAVTGGGSRVGPSGGKSGEGDEGLEVQWCAIDVQMVDAERSAQLICNCLNRHGAAKGSQLEFYVENERYVADFGVSEGISLYLSGTDLPKEVYEQHKFNDVMRLMNELIAPEPGGRGTVLDCWHGPTESAIYMYGRSAELMETAIAPLLATNPLCKGARVVVIA
ncbi:MAG: hypothetical protein ACREJO_17720 [Phycisphaerales bacterium]